MTGQSAARLAPRPLLDTEVAEVSFPGGAAEDTDFDEVIGDLEVIADSESDSKPSVDAGGLAAEARFSLEAGLEMVRSRESSKEPAIPTGASAAATALTGLTPTQDAVALPPLLDEGLPPILGDAKVAELRPTSQGWPTVPASMPAMLPPSITTEQRNSATLPSPLQVPAPILAPPPRLPPGAPAMPLRPPNGQTLFAAATTTDRPLPPTAVQPLIVPPVIPPLPGELRIAATLSTGSVSPASGTGRKPGSKAPSSTASELADLDAAAGRGPPSSRATDSVSPGAHYYRDFVPERTATIETAVAAAAAAKAAAEEAAVDCMSRGAVGIPGASQLDTGRGISKGAVGMVLPPSPLNASSRQGGMSSSSLNNKSGKLSELPAAVVMGTLEQYSRFLVGFPKSVLAAYILMVLTVLVVGGIFKVPNFQIEEDFSTFIRADGAAMRNRMAFMAALPVRAGPDDRRRLQSRGAAHAASTSARPLLEISEGRLVKERRLSPAHDGPAHERRLRTDFYLSQTLTIVYPKGPGQFPGLEAALVELPDWRRLCSKVPASLQVWCWIGESMPRFSRPTKIGNRTPGVVFAMRFDGGGEGMPLPVTMTYMEESVATYDPGELETPALTDFRRYLPRDFVPPSPYGPDSFAQSGSSPSACKSRYTFNFLVGSDEDPINAVWAAIKDTMDSYRQGIADSIWPFLVEQASSGSGPIYYYGDRIGSYEIQQVLYSDITFALGSGVFVMAYMRLHTRSFIITLSSVMLIIVSVPLAYIFTPMGKVNVASFLSIFLLTGIGCDVIFVFTDFWDQSALKGTKHERLSWTIAHAGRSCLATSTTTAASFLANVGSALQTLREFGLFMGFCVMNVFFLTLLILPPILLLTEKKLARDDLRIADLGCVDVSAGQHVALVAEHAPLATSPSHLRCNGRTAATDRDGLSFSRRQLLKLTVFVSGSPLAVLSLTLTMSLVFAIGVGVSIEMQTTTPEIFPSDHNQVKSLEWAGKFVDTDPPPRNDEDFTTPLEATVCLAYADMPSGAVGVPCCLYWCDAMSSPSAGRAVSGGVAAGGGGSGANNGDPVEDGLELASCWVGTPQTYSGVPTDFASCRGARVSMRLIATEPPTGDSTWRQEWHDVLRTSLGATRATTASSRVQTLRSLAMEDWSIGTVTMARFFSMGDATLNWPAGDQECRVDAICAVGPQACRVPDGWAYVGDIHIQLAPPVRLLQESPATVNEANQINVAVVWGLRPALYTPVVGSPAEAWSFDPNFQPRNPWAQRALLAMCSHPWVQPGGELAVLTKNCWVASFRDMLRDVGEKFPSREFDARMDSWFEEEPLQGPENTWYADGTLKACKVEFKVNKDEDMAAESAVAYRQKWDDYIDARNAEAAVTANFAWHTAQKWVAAEAEEAIVSSTLSTICISALSAWLGVLIFSGDPALACMVTLLVLTIILGLAFFMSCIMNWQIGPIEVISLVIFVGYSIDFSLHIAHSFGEVDPEDPELLELEAITRNRKSRHELSKRTEQAARRGQQGTQGTLFLEFPVPVDGLAAEMSPRDVRVARVRTAVLRLGGATLSSAVSTVGSNIFLLCCTMNIFVKLGAVVIAVTIVSIVSALIVLPAALILCGPPHGPWFANWVMSLCKGKKGEVQPGGGGEDEENGHDLGENGRGEKLVTDEGLGFDEPCPPKVVIGIQLDAERGSGDVAKEQLWSTVGQDEAPAVVVEKVTEAAGQFSDTGVLVERGCPSEPAVEQGDG